MNLFIVTETAHGVNVDVRLEDGHTERIEGLYDRDAAIAYTHMKLAGHGHGPGPFSAPRW